MNKSLLENLKESSSYFIDIVSYLIRADIEIVDVSLRCLSRKIVNDTVLDNTGLSIIHKKCIETGMYQLIESPRKNQICNICNEKYRCLKKLEMGFPIVFEGKVIGAVGISCYDINEREKILRGLDTYIQFINKVLDLMCRNLKSQQEVYHNEQTFLSLKDVAEALNYGIIVAGKDGYIKYANNLFKKMIFEDTAVEAEGKNVSLKTASNGAVELEIEDKILNLQGDIIRSNINREDTILLYNEDGNPAVPDDLDYDSTQEYSLDGMTFLSENMIKLQQKISKISLTSSTVLIIGEKGSGREYAARCIHYSSARKDFPFVSVNCDNISMNALSREVFGYCKNGRNFKGSMERAGEGVLIFNNVQYLSKYMQDKIREVSEKKYIAKEGMEEPVPVKCRIIYSLEKSDDCYERIDCIIKSPGIIPFEIPAVRQCKEDIYYLYNLCSRKYCDKFDIPFVEANEHNLPLLAEYKWPENLREIDMAAQDCIFACFESGADPWLYLTEYIESRNKPEDDFNFDTIPTLKEVEIKLILKAVEKYGNTTEGKKQAAQALNIGIATIYRKLAELES